MNTVLQLLCLLVFYSKEIHELSHKDNSLQKQGEANEQSTAHNLIMSIAFDNSLKLVHLKLILRNII